MIKVLFPTSANSSLHAVRGVGRYTQQLVAALQATKKVEVLEVGSKQRPDIIHYPFFDLFFPTLPLHFLAKTVVTIHDVIPLVFPDHYPVGKRGKLNFIRQKLALKFVSAIITDSKHSKIDIETYLGLKEAQISVISLAPASEFVPQPDKVIESVRRQFNLPKQYMLYVGDINYNKNLPQLIKSLKYLPWNVQLVCVGKSFYPHDIPEWQVIANQIALSNVEKRVKFITNLQVDQFAELSAMYAGAICYVQPSIYEGFGLPVLEAMACKSPVVCAQISSLIEVTGGEYAFYAKPTAEGIVEAVERVLGLSQTARKSWLQSAYAWSQTYTWAKTAEQTLAVYQKVLGK